MRLKDFHTTILISSLMLLAFSAVWGRDFITRGEGREALVAQAMLQSGNWVLPQGYANDIPSKPPFLHWFISIFSLANGEVSEVTARLPSVLAFISMVLILYNFIKARFNKEVAFYSACVLSTAFEWYRSGVTCRVDALFSAMISAGLLSYYKWYEKSFKGIPVWTIMFLTGAVLCKGPVAIVLPTGIFMIFMLSNRSNFFSAIKRLCLIFIPVIFISIIWYITAYKVGGQVFFDKVYAENVQRFMGSMEDEPHKHNALYLLASILLGFMPWTLVVLPAFLILLSRKELKLSLHGTTAFNKFSIISIAVFILFFCMPSSKRAVYLLPVYPLIAVYAGIFLQTVMERRPSILAKTANAAGILSLLLILSIAILIAGFEYFSKLNFFEKPLYAYTLETLQMSFSGLNVLEWLLLTGLSIAAVAMFFNRTAPVRSLFVLFVMLSSNIQYFIIRIHSNRLSPKPFAEVLKNNIPAELKLYSYINELYALSFYMNRKIYRLEPAAIQDQAEIIAFQGKLERIKSEIGSSLSIQFESENYVEKPLDKLILLKINN